MERRRELIVTNILALAVIISVLIAGWWEAALFGLVVLVVMDLIAILRERGARVDLRMEEEKERDMDIDPDLEERDG